MADPISKYYDSFKRYPSNAQVWTVAKDADELFDPELMTDINFGSSEAPKGHFILSVFDTNRQGIVEDSAIDIQEETRPNTNTFFAGRFWCAGGTSQSLASRVFYSQLIEDDRNIGKCYGSNDPTSEHFNEPLDTDGGVIKIPEIGEITRLESVGNSVVILASNGVWAVQGTGESGFTPTAHNIVKVSSSGTRSGSSLIAVGNNIFYWGTDGIFSMSYDKLEGLGVTNITKSTIAELYLSIPALSKKYATGVYDSRNSKIKWLYNKEEVQGGLSRYKYDSVLILDLLLNAFTRYDIGTTTTDSPFMAGLLENPEEAVNYSTENILVGTDELVDTALNNVTNRSSTLSSGGLGVKLLTLTPQGSLFRMTFAGFKSTTFEDWKTSDGTGVDVTAFAIPSYETFGEPSREKRATYVTSHFNRTESGFDTDLLPLEPSSCMMQAQWDWADSGAGNLLGSEQQIYRYRRIYMPENSADTFDYGQSVLTTKTKIRGSGNALTLKFRSEAGKDFQLLGWTTNVSVRA